jgi:hypothetical protein
MRKSTAKIISVALHPALIPTYLFAILFFSTRILPYNTDQKVALLGMIFLLTFVLPTLSLFSYYKLKLISSFAIEKREERFIPFFSITIVYLIITYFFFEQAHIYFIISWIMLGISMVLMMVSVVTLVHKVSVHSAGMSGGLGVLLGLQYQHPDENFLYSVLCFTLLTGVVMSARLSLKAHNLTELLTGFGVGFCLTFGLMLL